MVIPILHNSIVANFRVGGRPQKWTPLAASTLMARQERAKKGIGRGFRNIAGFDQPILQDTGSLFQTIGSVNEIHKNYAEYGTSDYPRAPVLQGTGFGRSGGTTINFPRKFIAPLTAGGVLHWKTPDGKDVFSKGHWRKAFTITIPGRPFILFQDDDVKDITSYAAAFAFGSPKPPTGI